MSYDSAIGRDVLPIPIAVAATTVSQYPESFSSRQGIDGIPGYLSSYYWWAYIHPNAVRLFERGWLINLILWGNYARLRDAAIFELGEHLPGRTLQVACVYGDLTCRLSERAASGGGTVDVVDVLPIQLTNLRRKLSRSAPARLLAMDSTSLNL